MRVLEIGPGEAPATGLIWGDYNVEYVGVEPGINGHTEEGFWERIRREECPVDSVTYCPVRLEEMSGPLSFGFDIGLAANVFGDPAVVGRNTGGELAMESFDLARSLMSDFVCRLANEAELNILETITPLGLETLMELLRSTGAVQKQIFYGDDLEQKIYELYGNSEYVRSKFVASLSQDQITAHSRFYSTPLVEPYLAVFTKPTTLL